MSALSNSFKLAVFHHVSRPELPWKLGLCCSFPFSIGHWVVFLRIIHSKASQNFNISKRLCDVKRLLPEAYDVSIELVSNPSRCCKFIFLRPLLFKEDFQMSAHRTSPQQALSELSANSRRPIKVCRRKQNVRKKDHVLELEFTYSEACICPVKSEKTC